jgi:biotin carboxyl carrier protein
MEASLSASFRVISVYLHVCLSSPQCGGRQ